MTLNYKNTFRKYFTEVVLAVSAALAVPVYAAPPSMESGRFIPYSARKAKRAHGTPSTQDTPSDHDSSSTHDTTSHKRSKLEKTIIRETQTLEPRVRTLEQDHAKLKQGYADILKRLHDHRDSSDSPKDSVDKSKQFQDDRLHVDDKCQIAYTTALGLANEVTSTYKDTADLTKYVKELEAETTKTSYEKATLLVNRLLQEASTLDEADATTLVEKVTQAYKPCSDSQTTYSDKLKQTKELLDKNATETEEQKRARIRDELNRNAESESDKQARINRSIKEQVPALVRQNLPKSKVHFNALLGGEYGNGWHGRVGGEVCYTAGDILDLCTEGAVMRSILNEQTSTETSPPVVASVGPSYQTTSTFQQNKTTAKNAHYAVGARAGVHLYDGQSSKIVFGLGVEVQGGEKSVVLRRSRSTQLQDQAGNNLGDVHSISDVVDQKESYRTVVPNVNLEGCYKGICLRARLGYDTQEQSGKLQGFKPGLDLKLGF